MAAPLTILACAASAWALATLSFKTKARLQLSRAKTRSLAGHARIAKRLASLIPFYEYDEGRFFCPDDAPDEVAIRRRAGFRQLSQLFVATRALTEQVKSGLSDLQFTTSYRVPFQYASLVISTSWPDPFWSRPRA